MSTVEQFRNSIIKGQTAQQTPNTVADSNAYDKMDLSSFINILVTEMQNQDPLNPMDNSQILTQMSQIKAIGSNDKLTKTLTSLQLQQDMATGSALLNQTVTGLNTNNKMITGVVDKISVADGKVQVHVGDNTVAIKNIASMNNVSSDTQLELDLETGNALLTKTVSGKNANGKTVTGPVEKVTVSDNTVQLNVGQNTISLGDLSTIEGLDSDSLIDTYRESGNSLVNQTVTGLNAEGKLIVGKVDKLSIVDGRVQLQVGSHTVELKNVREIENGGTATTGC
jgi:flagellar basal-body rod modification protein FlgD